jgi:predicted small lipoprotein YifL
MSLFVKSPPSKLAAALVLAAFALSLGSCGRRGALEPPPGAPASTVPLTGTPDEGPSQYPGDAAGQNTANSGAQATPAQAGAKPGVPHTPRPFVLDPLL